MLLLYISLKYMWNIALSVDFYETRFICLINEVV